CASGVCLLSVYLYFFFQAEDGIRDFHVTGVQTCALPISQWSERLLAHLYRHFPQTRAHVDFHELSTPLSTQYFCRYQQGEIYGLNHTPQRFQTRWLGPRTPIRNLYLTGQDALTAGVGGALIGGVFAAAAVTGGLKAARIMKPLLA